MRVEGPNPGLGLAVLRVVVGVSFVAHGAPRLFQGGVAGLAATLAEAGVPVPEATAWLVSLLQFGGGLALVVGLFVTPVALLLAAHLVAGIVLVHAPAGWHVVGPLAEHPPGGVELNVVLVAALLALVLAGPGAAAMDARRRPSDLHTLAPDDGGGEMDGGPGAEAADPVAPGRTSPTAAGPAPAEGEPPDGSGRPDGRARSGA